MIHLVSVYKKLRHKDTNRLKVKGWKKIPANSNQMRAIVAILILDKIDLKSKIIPRNKDGHLVMIKVQSTRKIQ